MLRTDLHIHSEYSLDGELSVRNILSECRQVGLSVISITDHNLVTGISEAMRIAPEFALEVIPGVEIDCNYKGIDLHVLGYNISWLSPDFSDLEKQYTDKVMRSFTRMIENLSRLGIEVDGPEVLLKADGRLPSAELIAEVLLDNEKYQGNKKLDPYRPGGYRSDMPYINFYLDFFAQGKPAYVKIDYMNYAECVSLIKQNGGIPVVAHPGLNLKGREEIILELLDGGAEGLEVFNNYHTGEQIRYFADLALERKLWMTCGSDFHGKTKPLIKPGVYRTLSTYESSIGESMERLFSTIGGRAAGF
jgi:predicted metal-dependent phosphoesterase TrpH